MAGIERQHHFGEVSPEWQSFIQAPQEIKNPILEIDNACISAFERTQALWQRYSQFIPEGYDFSSSETQEIQFPGGSLFLSQRTQKIEYFPKLKDLEYPQELEPFFTELIKRNKKKENMRFPWHDSFAATIHIYGQLPVPEEKDVLGLTKVADIFDEWAPGFFEKWHSRVPKVLGSLAQVYNEQGEFYSFGFSNTGQLVFFDSLQNQPAAKDYKIINDRVNKLPKLSTRAVFRSGKLYSLYQEVPNGTLFPDPKGPINSIWPKWVKKGIHILDEWLENNDFDIPDPATGEELERYFQAARERNEPLLYEEEHRQATKEDWEWYLQRIREKKLVFSPRTGEDVHQTERQARENLERNRLYIYNKIPQGFHFYRAGNKILGEVGYSVKSKYRRRRQTYIPKHPINPDSYHELSEDQTAQLLSRWDPAGSW